MRELAMTSQKIAAAMQRVEAVLRRRPEVGLHEDAPATARWERGTRVVSSHANGAQLVTDMPTELGGGGDQVTPGWLFRAGLASCFATRIAMQAAAAGVDLTMLEVIAGSWSDTRGVFRMAEPSGEPVGAGPRDVHLSVKISAPGVAVERLQSLVEDCNSCSPVSAAVRGAVPVALRIEVLP
jgi:organic hydroperoxide reductase OsmC/OhrA